MKKTSMFIFLFCVYCSLTLNAQINLDLSVGNTSSLHQLKENTASSFGINSFSTDISYIPKNFGVAMQFQTSKFDTNEDFIDALQSFDVKYDSDRDSWRSNFIFLGPIVKLGKKKLSVEIFPKIGLGKIDSPNRRVTYTLADEDYLLYADNPSEDYGKIKLVSGVDTKIRFALTEKLGLHLSMGINTNKFFGDGSSTTYRELGIDGTITEEELVTGRLLEDVCDSYQLLNLNAGINLRFGGKTPKTKKKKSLGSNDNPNGDNRDLNPNSNPCIQLNIVSPLPMTKYRMEGQERPHFKWKVNTEKKLTFLLKIQELNISQEGVSTPKTVFETKTTSLSMAWPKKVKWPSNIEFNDEVLYSWSVQVIDSRDKLCNGQDHSTFSVTNQQLDVLSKSLDIECMEPAYNQNGDVCYNVTENWSIKNSYSANANFVSHIVQTKKVGFTTRTPTPIPSFPTLPGNNATTSFSVSYSICVPLGETTMESALQYIVPGQMSTADRFSLIDSLPPCICDACEDWTINLNNTKLEPWVNRSAGQDYIYIEDDLTAIAPSGNIVRVEAEIIGYEHWKPWGSSLPDDPELNQCFTCNIENGQHGTFVPYFDASSNMITNILNTGFINLDRAYYREAGLGPNNPPSRNIYWRAPSPAGVSMPLTSKLTVGVPNFSELEDCCGDEFKLYIRYSFTAFDPETESCVVCSEVLYYYVKRNASTIIKKTTPQSTY